VCCSALQGSLQHGAVCVAVCVAVCCSVLVKLQQRGQALQLQCVAVPIAVWCSACCCMRCSVLQCVVQCVAVCESNCRCEGNCSWSKKKNLKRQPIAEFTTSHDYRVNFWESLGKLRQPWSKERISLFIYIYMYIENFSKLKYLQVLSQESTMAIWRIASCQMIIKLTFENHIYICIYNIHIRINKCIYKHVYKYTYIHE